VDLILAANWGNNTRVIKSDVFILKRAQLVASYRFLSKRWGWGTKKIVNFLNRLKTQQMITLQTQHQTTIITICNYGRYQLPIGQKETVKATAKATEGQQSGNSEGTKQINVNKEKRKDNTIYMSFETSIFNSWNSMCERNPTLSKVLSISKERRKKLKERFETAHFREKILETIDSIPNYPFLLGKSVEGWKASFDWIIYNDNNYLKVIEGFYGRARSKGEELLQSLKGDK